MFQSPINSYQAPSSLNRNASNAQGSPVSFSQISQLQINTPAGQVSGGTVAHTANGYQADAFPDKSQISITRKLNGLTYKDAPKLLPLATAHPWKIIIRKTHVPPGNTLTEPRDFENTLNRLRKSLISNDPAIPEHSRSQLDAMIRSGNGMVAIQNATQLPLYFAEKFPVKHNGEFANRKIIACIQAKGIYLVDIEKMSANGLPMIVAFGSYDESLGKQQEAGIDLSIGDTLHSLTFKSIETANRFVKTWKSYKSSQQAQSKTAVGLTGYVATDNTGFNFNRGTIIEIVDRDNNNGWLMGKVQGMIGWFPQELAEILVDAPQFDAQKKVILKGQAKQRAIDFENAPISPVSPTTQAFERFGGSMYDMNVTSVQASHADLNNSDMRLGSISNMSEMKSVDALNTSSYNLSEYPLNSSKLGASSMALIGDKTKDGKYTFVEFAKSNFLVDMSKLQKNKGKAPDVEVIWREVVSRVKFTDIPIKTPLLRLGDMNDFRLAVETFSSIMQYMGDLPTKKTKHQLVSYILQTGMKRVSIRDELYCQVLKQTTSNKSRKSDSVKRGWDLLMMMCYFFQPLNNLEIYLHKHLESVANDASRGFATQALICLDALRKSKLNQRKNVLSQEELDCFENSAVRVMKIRFPENATKSITIDPLATGKDIVRSICERYDPKHPEFYQITFVYEPGGYQCVPIPSDDILSDCIINCERLMGTYNQIARLNIAHFELAFKRKIWLGEKERPPNSAIMLMFHQLVPDFLSGTMLTDNEFNPLLRERIAQALACLIRLRKVDVNDYQRVVNFIPEAIRDHPSTDKEYYIRMIQTYALQYQSMDDVDVQYIFLDQIRSFKNYGCAFFMASQSSDPRCPNGCLMAVGKDGFRMVDPKTKTIIDSFNYENIMTYRFTESEFFLRTGKTKTVLRFQTIYGFVITDLLGSYIEVYTNRLKAENNNAHQVAILNI